MVNHLKFNFKMFYFKLILILACKELSVVVKGRKVLSGQYLLANDTKERAPSHPVYRHKEKENFILSLQRTSPLVYKWVLRNNLFIVISSQGISFDILIS